LELFCTAAYIAKITDGNLGKALLRQEFYGVILEALSYKRQHRRGPLWLNGWRQERNRPVAKQLAAIRQIDGLTQLLIQARAAVYVAVFLSITLRRFCAQGSITVPEVQ
jgi:hypothetical protein